MTYNLPPTVFISDTERRDMRRRRYLALLGGASAGLAGCMGSDDDGTPMNTPTGTPTETPTATVTLTASPTAEPETTSTPTATPVQEDSELAVPREELVLGPAGGLYVDAEIANVGTDATGQVIATVLWYDDSGYYLGSSQATIPRLRADEWWHPWIPYQGGQQEEVSDYELSLAHHPNPPVLEASGLEVLGSDLDVGDGVARIEGRIQNQRSDGTTISAIAFLYESNEILTTRAREELVPSGDVWRFWLEYQAGEHAERTTDVELYAVD